MTPPHPAKQRQIKQKQVSSVKQTDLTRTDTRHQQYKEPKTPTNKMRQTSDASAQHWQNPNDDKTHARYGGTPANSSVSCTPPSQTIKTWTGMKIAAKRHKTPALAATSCLTPSPWHDTRPFQACARRNHGSGGCPRSQQRRDWGRAEALGPIRQRSSGCRRRRPPRRATEWRGPQSPRSR